MNSAPTIENASPVKTVLRDGFTTGTAATAAAMAALEVCLSHGDPRRIPTKMDVPLPPFADSPTGETPTGFLSVPIERAELTAERASTGGVSDIAGNVSTIPFDERATASVIKDGGDDPDATHGARIVAHITLENTPAAEQGPLAILIEGGEGVGRVTLPGLPVPVGSAAINPVPRQQITHGLRLIAARYGCTRPLRVTISVPNGAALAHHTFNPRLGIMGGISILGTQGTVKPYSHEAWKATIRQGLAVAEATGCATLCLSTGRRSEKLLLELYPHLPAQAAVQVADFAEFSLHEAGRRSFTELAWGCFFGKLVKLAQGHSYTHARSAELDFDLLAHWCVEAGAALDCAKAVQQCVTANHALELLMTSEGEDKARLVVHNIALKAADVARRFVARPSCTVRMHVFHLNGKELVRV